MDNRGLIFGLLFVSALYLLGYLMFGLFRDVSIYIKIYFLAGLVVATALFFISKAKSDRFVSPINGSVDQNYDRLFREFSDAGFRIEECEPLAGRQLIVFFNHPGKLYFISMGFILLLAGIFPGIVWFHRGRDKLSITLKEESGFVRYVFETNNNKYAGRIWQKINLKFTKELLGSPPNDLQTTARVV